MPHIRTRILESALKESLGWSPITAVFGQRQTGKTTLLRSLSRSFKSFDQAQLAIEFAEHGEQILESSEKPLFLDEVQKFPPVFDALKMVADRKRRPGQFLITGSVRFAQRKPIRESLTGRTTLWELLPLTTSELLELPFRHLFKDAFSKHPLDRIRQQLQVNTRMIERQFKCGGLPGICFIRSHSQRENSFRNHVATLIERDLPLVREVKTQPEQILELLRQLIPIQGEPVSFAPLGRRLRLSAPTIKALLHALEGLFLVRSHGKGYFFEDLGLAHWLEPNAMQQRGRSELLWIFTELRAQAAYRQSEILSFSEYRTRGDAHVPFVFQLRDGNTLGVTYDPGEYPSEKSIKSLHSLRKKSRGRFAALLLHSGTRAWEQTPGYYCMPYHWIA